MITSRKNPAVKAIQAVMAANKKYDAAVLTEWELACNTNKNRGHVYSQNEVKTLYSRDSWDGEHGATKTCHITSHTGDSFQYIVVKRHQTGGYIDEHAEDPNSPLTGNQLIDEINCWLQYEDKAESDLLCPILKYFTSKSDKVSAVSEKMQENVVIIAQRAVYVSRAKNACYQAEQLNDANGLTGEDADTRYEKMSAFSKRQGWRDALYNGGNSGVIFDYAQNCYKAVFIDYAL